MLCRRRRRRQGQLRTVGTGATRRSPPGRPGHRPCHRRRQLPCRGEFSSSGDGTFHGVGTAGATAGDVDGLGDETYTYVVELEDGVNGSSFGGGDAFSATVDAVSGDPVVGVHRRLRLRTHQRALPGHPGPAGAPGQPGDHGTAVRWDDRPGDQLLIQGPDDEGEAGAGRVIINLARWVRGSGSFEGDLGGYRQYVLNHEIGHGIGFAVHQPSGGRGVGPADDAADPEPEQR